MMAVEEQDVASSPSQDESGDERDGEMSGHKERSAGSGSSENPSRPNEKDPSRPKRRKARRACLACQRAHLTCGDERPCQRCVKRGLADHCQDGYRKKAKYLHDAPPEALEPGVRSSFSLDSGPERSRDALTSMSDARSPFQQTPFPSHTQPHSFQAFQTSSKQIRMGPPMQDSSMMNPFGGQSSPLPSHIHPQNPSPIQDMSTMLGQASPTVGSQGYSASMFDANAPPGPFNFDLASMNFGNHYGALEFGMLGHMSSGANDNLMQPGQRNRSSSTTFDTPGGGSSGFPDNSSDRGSMSFTNESSVTEWQGRTQSQGVSMDAYAGNFNLVKRESFAGPFAFSIGAGPGSHLGGSPSSNGADPVASYDNTGFDPSIFSPNQQFIGGSDQPKSRQTSKAEPVVQDEPSPVISRELQAHPYHSHKKRRRDPVTIYEIYNKPYPYTAAFHALTALLRRRFSSAKRLRIAQALGQIRPSFISCTKELIGKDLALMELCFQRSLLQYEDYLASQGTPTIVCRRTGEVALVGKEFSLLTGWRKDVLLGREPNLNINSGSGNGGTSGNLTGASSRGVNTPRLPAEAASASVTEPGRPQPVFLAELLDVDGVIHFYEEFAKVAFADSRVTRNQRCTVLKYKTKDDPGFGVGAQPEQDRKAAAGAAKGETRAELAGRTRRRTISSEVHRHQPHQKAEPIISAEAGMYKLGDKNGKVDCMCTWEVKRDLFNMPMMIVLNFLPII